MGATAEGIFAGLISQGLPCQSWVTILFRRFLTYTPSTALFSMYLTPKAVGNAELTLGGIDNSKFTGKFNSHFSYYGFRWLIVFRL